MQLDTRRTTKKGYTVFQVLRDGVVVGEAVSQQQAFKYMDVLWAARPEADKVLEQLYTGE